MGALEGNIFGAGVEAGDRIVSRRLHVHFCSVKQLVVVCCSSQACWDAVASAPWNSGSTKAQREMYISGSSWRIHGLLSVAQNTPKTNYCILLFLFTSSAHVDAMKMVVVVVVVAVKKKK